MLPTNNQQNRNVGKESPVMLALSTAQLFVPFPAHTHTVHIRGGYPSIRLNHGKKIFNFNE